MIWDSNEFGIQLDLIVYMRVLVGTLVYSAGWLLFKYRVIFRFYFSSSTSGKGTTWPS